MTRFLLIDQSLRGYSGHFHSCATRTLAAAQRRGFETALVTNRAYHRSPQDPQLTLPAFRYTSTQRPLADAPLLQQLWKQRGRGNTAWSPESRGHPLRSLAQMSFNLCDRVAAPARRAAKTRSFTEDLDRVLCDLQPTRGDHAFFPTIHPCEFAGLTRSLAGIGSGTAHLLIRDDLDPDLSRTPWRRRFCERSVQSMRSLPETIGAWTIRLYSDSDRLSAQYHRLSGKHVIATPVPIDVSGPAPTTHRDDPDDLNIVVLGEPRDEKGFWLLPELVDAIITSHPMVRFTIQIGTHVPPGEPRSQHARAALCGANHPQVTLLRESLDADTYARTLREASVLLLPYDPVAYRARTSGILAEALAEGVPSIVPAGTWMEDAMTFHGGQQPGGVLTDPREVIPTLESVLDSWTTMRHHALGASNWWRGNMTGEALCAALLD